MLPLSRLRRELTLFTVSGTLLLVISFSQNSCSYAQSSNKNAKGLHIIATKSAYYKSVRVDENKRFVAVKDYVKPFLVDWVYASAGNFTGQVLYKNPEAYVRLEAAKALQKVEAELAKTGLGLKFFDTYRPYSVTKKMWKVVPDEKYAANPAKGSGHNRGAAVDITIVDLKTKEELQMGTAFDDFTEKAHHNYQNLSAEVKANRNLLRSTMEKCGFVALDTEWWHYSLPNASTQFELVDLEFTQMKKIAANKAPTTTRYE